MVSLLFFRRFQGRESPRISAGISNATSRSSKVVLAQNSPRLSWGALLDTELDGSATDNEWTLLQANQLSLNRTWPVGLLTPFVHLRLT